MVSRLIGGVLCCVIYGLFAVECNVIVRNQDICGIYNGRRLYLELGEQGILYAKNVSSVKNSPRQQQHPQGSRLYATNSSHEHCSLELVTCPSCAITVTFKSLALPHSCSDSGMMMDSPCRCDYVWISEPPYEDISGTPYCGLYAPITYRSNTRTVSITLLYSQSHNHAFTIEYVSERNRVHLKGWDPAVTKGFNGTVGGILTSPFFPARYPRDLGIEYVITCPTEAPSCRVRVLFSDFQLATVSIIEFYDWNGQRLDVSSGARFRPPIIVSSGPSLLIRFYANGGTGLGYKAFYSYVIGHRYDKAIQPITDCGGYVENLGGTITMIDMVTDGVKTYDCVWLIRPPKNFLHMKTHVYLKIVTFADMAGNTELIIRQGPTSALLPLEVLRHPASQLQPPRMREHITPIVNGFHVSLRGTFGVNSKVAIAYAAFGYIDCYAGSDFLCQNHRCIQSQLNCDGFDHCGDNSDEPSTCLRDWGMEPRDGKWHMNKANYYFPKIDRYPDLKTATLVFIASSLGLIILISALIVLLYRMGARSRQQRELQSRLQTISELLDRTVFDIADGARIDEVPVHDEPPVYEAPPGYDEVIKVGFENEEIKRKKKRNLLWGARNRSSLSHCSQELPTSSSLILDLAGVSRNRETMSTTTTASTITTVNPVERIPESPPPPYITPPGSVLDNYGICLSRHSVTHTSVPVNLRGNHMRRVWNRANELRHSLPEPDEVAAFQSSESIDYEALGAYLRNYTPRGSASVETFDPQPRSLPDVGLITSQRSSGDFVGLRDVDVDGVAEDEETTNKNRPTTTYDRGQPPGCACEGACGCANNHKLVQSEEIKAKEESELKTKRMILKLFKSSSSQSTSNPDTEEPEPSAENSSDHRRPSVCSGDTYMSLGTMFSTCSSPYELEEHDFTSETNSILENASIFSKTPTRTPVRATKITINTTGDFRFRNRKHARKYASCDTDSLFESIKALDSFLEKRSVSIAQTRNTSNVTTPFGTPRHHRRRTLRHHSSQHRIFNCVRGWKSSEDTSS
ncbi:uncharacterized protein LOC123263832 isoform X1 [Cotesia glomerata]|uniref:CUB domain-containing protein n=1 Tax=Cotesia glomerata TaxID=32391 RepID=A0AAV7J783_COTGL|nr:uncharacterized protein LOC123263832 isoform X1 [Cotesia glomerata]KAH0567072.1 hypothetical protein KQX54_006464 [Cotesia glomerata]